MAKQHTKANGQQTTNGDIPVVAPINMGKGIKWNNETNTYEVNIAENQPIGLNELGELEVRISELESNQLRLLDGKFYYGTQARVELANLYVDAIDGKDQNPLTVKGAGTRANPLRTLAYAINLAENGTSRAVYVRENQDHIMSPNMACLVKSGKLSINPYGTKTDELTQQEHGNNYLVTEKLIQTRLEPRIVFQGVRKLPYKDSTGDFDRMLFSCIGLLANSNISFSGTRLVNDLNFNFVAALRQDNKDYSSSTNPYRIESQENTVINLTNVRLTTLGKPHVSGDIGSSESVLRNNMVMKSEADLYQMSFFYGTVLQLQLRNIHDLDDVDCYLFGTQGWAGRYGSNVNISEGGGIELNALTKRIFNPTIEILPSGDKRLLAPVSNIRTQYWG